MRPQMSPIRAYSCWLYRHPLIVLVLSFLASTVLPLLILFFQPVRLTPNAELGFDTKNTEWSGPRLSWQLLSVGLTKSNQVHLGKRTKRGWADGLLSLLGGIQCYETPIPLMNHLSQVVVALDSEDALYHSNTLKELCDMESYLRVDLDQFNQFTPYRSIWSIASYAACISPMASNCSELVPSDISHLRDVIRYCWSFRDQMIACGVGCAKEKCSCEGVPANCSSQMLFDVYYRMLPMSLEARPFYVNLFLPVFTRTGYATQNVHVPLKWYDNLELAIRNYTSNVGLELKGIAMDVKRDRLLDYAIGDSFLAVLSAALVLLCVCIHSQSVAYSLALCVQLCLAVLVSLAIFSFFSLQFPLLNLVTFVLLIAIGSDDAFILHSAIPKKLDVEGFQEAMAHVAGTMFLTSFSTAVPFFVNCFSDVLVFRCFGLFAGLTVVINYMLVLSFLPSLLLLIRGCPSIVPSWEWTGWWPMLSWVLIQGRFVWMASLFVVVISSCTLAYNDLHLPEANPLQLFVSSNPHEWYDNHAASTFSFVTEKVSIALPIRLVWGVLPTWSPSHFEEYFPSTLASDPSFSLSTPMAIRHLADTLTRLRHLPFISHAARFWPERFLDWSLSYPCAQGFVCCNMSSPLFNSEWLAFCLRNSTQYLPTHYNDTPLFSGGSFDVIGYTAMLPTHFKYSHKFSNLSWSLGEIGKGIGQMEGGWWTTEWYLMSTWFDLQRAVVSDCAWSVVVSLLVVTVFAVAHLRVHAIPAVVCIASVVGVSIGMVTLLGWVVGILEAVILVLVVGLSFDYTLHYGAALPSSGCPSHRIASVVRKAAVPVSLAALSSMLAGAAMLLSQTHAFFQVGVFLLVSTSVSWIYSMFFFLPLLFVTLPSDSQCSACTPPAVRMF